MDLINRMYIRHRESLFSPDGVVYRVLRLSKAFDDHFSLHAPSTGFSQDFLSAVKRRRVTPMKIFFYQK